MTRAHTHRCCKCDGEIACCAPTVADHDSAQKICILVYDEGEQTCDDCSERADHVVESPLPARVH